MPEIIVPGAPDADPAATPNLAPVAVVDDFLPLALAEAMRADIDAHFAKPHAHTEAHQIWNYWYVPELYTYLRAQPEKVFRPDRVETFMATLREWSRENLGLANVTHPFLSLYVSGCRQGWHNDAGNGRFAFVYSLTRNDRATIGGETLVMREGVALRSNLTRPMAGGSFYQAVEPLFNRLVVFDDRVAHAVERVDGSMDPVQGRFVMHGHMSEAGTHVQGALPAAAVNAPVNAALMEFATGAAADLPLYHGPLSLRLVIDPSGAAEVRDVMLDRVLHPDPTHDGWEPLRESLLDRLEAVRFPAAEGETTVILPVMFGVRPRTLR